MRVLPKAFGMRPNRPFECLTFDSTSLTIGLIFRRTIRLQYQGRTTFCIPQGIENAQLNFPQKRGKRTKIASQQIELIAKCHQSNHGCFSNIGNANTGFKHRLRTRAGNFMKQTEVETIGSQNPQTRARWKLL